MRLKQAVYGRIGDLYLAAVVRKTDNFKGVTWLGNPIWQNVLDLWTLQEAISEIRPTVILETGTNRGGSAIFYANLLDLLDIDGQVLTVDIEAMHNLQHPRVEFMIGSSVDEPVYPRMRQAAEESTGPVLVVLDSDHSRDHVARELDLYAPLVTPGSLMLVQDAIIDSHPMFRADRPGPGPAIQAFLNDHPEFYVEQARDRRFLATHHPSGWLRRAS